MEADHQTASLSFDDSGANRLRDLAQYMGELIALYEASAEQMRQREQKLDERLQQEERFIHDQMTRMRSLLSDCEQIMTRAGVERWRLAAEENLRKGENHLKALQLSTEEFRQLSQSTCDRLDRATVYTVKGVSEAVRSFRLADFKHFTERCGERVEQAAIASVNNISRITRWFYWRKLLLVFSFTIVTVVAIGLYLDDEWPWESHNRAVQERQLGSAVAREWQQLSQLDRERIEAQLQNRSKTVSV